MTFERIWFRLALMTGLVILAAFCFLRYIGWAFSSLGCGWFWLTLVPLVGGASWALLRFRDVFLKPRCRGFSNRNVAVFLALALAHHDQPTVELQIEQFQIHHLQTAQSGCIDHFQNGANRAGPADRRDGCPGCIITCSISANEPKVTAQHPFGGDVSPLHPMRSMAKNPQPRHGTPGTLVSGRFT